ncbi:hypothetical protein AAG906_030754 [Vitis piasezkii]
MGNEAKWEIISMGDVELETSIRCKLVLKYVRHGYHSHLGDGKWKLTKGSLVLARRKKNNTLYKTETRLVKGEVNIVENEVFTKLWHKRLGHISEKRLQVLTRKKLLLVKVHIDVCTIQSNTLSGAFYYVTFIDDHSRKSFWGEVMRTTIDLINLSPSYPLEGDIPERVWIGKSISFEHLRVFGYRAFVHVPRDERSKLDSKTKQCIFLSYSNEEFGYRLWDLSTKKIIRSRDVVFFEDQTIEDLDRVKKLKPFSEE